MWVWRKSLDTQDLLILEWLGRAGNRPHCGSETQAPRDPFSRKQALRRGSWADPSAGSLLQNNRPSCTVFLLSQSWLIEIREQLCDHLVVFFVHSRSLRTERSSGLSGMEKLKNKNFNKFSLKETQWGAPWTYHFIKTPTLWVAVV